MCYLCSLRGDPITNLINVSLQDVRGDLDRMLMDRQKVTPVIVSEAIEKMARMALQREIADLRRDGVNKVISFAATHAEHLVTAESHNYASTLDMSGLPQYPPGWTPLLGGLLKEITIGLEVNLAEYGYYAMVSSSAGGSDRLFESKEK